MKGFTDEHAKCYNADEIILEHTSALSKHIYGDDLVIICDGTYFYRISMRTALDRINI